MYKLSNEKHHSSNVLEAGNGNQFCKVDFLNKIEDLSEHHGKQLLGKCYLTNEIK